MTFTVYRRSTSSIRVYNCSSGSLNPIRWCEWKRLAIRAADKFPCEEIVRCPSVVLRANNRLVFVIEFVLFHLLPAFFIDIVAMVNGIEPFLVSANFFNDMKSYFFHVPTMT